MRPMIYTCEENNRDHFNLLMLGDVTGNTGSINRFWNEVVGRKDPRIQHHPMISCEGWTSKAIPISLHGDAVPCICRGRAGVKSFDCYCWMCILGSGPTLLLKQYIFGLFTANRTRQTMPQAWLIICWSLWFAYLGTFPTFDHNKIDYTDPTAAEFLIAGHPLAAGLFIVLWLLKGDLKHFHENIDLRGYNDLDPCDFCPCKKTQRLHSTKPWMSLISVSKRHGNRSFSQRISG